MTEKTVLFIAPQSPRKGLGEVGLYGKLPSLAAYQLQRMTPKNWQFLTFDENLHPWKKHLYPLIKPDLVAITSFASNFLRALELADFFKKRGVPVVMGGHQATWLPQMVLKHADAIVRGEAERIWPQVLKDVEQGQLGYRSPIYEAEKGLDLEKLTYLREARPPRFHFFGIPMAFLQTRRGCPIGCDFCSVSVFSGRKVRQKSLKEIYQEIKATNLPKNGIVTFADDNIVAGEKQWVLAVFKTLEKANVRWIAQSDIRIALDRQLLKAAVKSGFLAALIGFEDPHAKVLESGVSKTKASWSDEYEEAIKILQKNKIITQGTFMFGFDGQTEEMIWDTLYWIIQTKIELVQITLNTPLPGTKLMERLIKEKRIKPAEKINWNQADFVHLIHRPASGGLSARKLRSLLKKGYDFVYSRKNIRRRLAGKDFGWQYNLALRLMNQQFGRILKD